jgi:hypothetical protein
VLVLGVVVLVVLPLLALCEIVVVRVHEEPAWSGARTAPADAVGRKRPRRLRRAGRGRYGREHGARQGPLLGPPSVARRAAPRSPMGSIGLAPADMKRSAPLRAGPAGLRGIASAR